MVHVASPYLARFLSRAGAVGNETMEKYGCFEGVVGGVCTEEQGKGMLVFLTAASSFSSFECISMRNFIRRKRESVRQRVKFYIMP